MSLAQPILPDLVKRRGVTVKKKSPSVLMIVNLFSPDLTRDNLYLSNYATIQLKDELSRLKGVGDITALGQHRRPRQPSGQEETRPAERRRLPTAGQTSEQTLELAGRRGQRRRLGATVDRRRLHRGTAIAHRRPLPFRFITPSLFFLTLQLSVDNLSKTTSIGVPL